jgi:hypothetical protein
MFLFYLDHDEDEPRVSPRDENNDDSKSDQQRFSNGSRVSAFHTHRGDDFYKKLMFYEKNASPNDANSPTRPSSSIPSATKPINGLTNRSAQQISTGTNLSTITAERMHRSKSYKDLLDPPIAHPLYYQQQQQPSSSSYYTTNTTPTIVGSMLGNGGGLTDFQRRQSSALNNNFISDDISSSSTGHLPKPPPGIPSQNAR